MSFKPLKAAKVELDKLVYPLYVTPKLDGIRCMIHNGVAMSINMKPIPNDYIQDTLSWYDHGLDGELMANGDFNNVQSAVMKKTGTPEFYFAVFDDFSDPKIPYEHRYKKLHKKVTQCKSKYVQKVEHKLIYDQGELESIHQDYILEGYEGTMVRSPGGIYKFGRSTVNQGILLKLKDWQDTEGLITGFVEKQHNANQLEEDNLGYAKRSTKQENLLPCGTAAGVNIAWQGLNFKVGFGPGFTDERKQYLWDNQHRYIGQIATFSYQNLSKDGIPRFGKLLRIRSPHDMTSEDLQILGVNLL